MLEEYRKHVKERAAEGITPKPLNADQVASLVKLLNNPPAGEDSFLLNLLTNRAPAGVDEAAYVKAAFLTDIAKGNSQCDLMSRAEATRLLGTMLGGYNIPPLVELLDDSEVGQTSANALKSTLLMFDAFHDVEEKRQTGNTLAQEVMESWANAEWFLSKSEVPTEIRVTVYKVPGETNTDDLSPAVDAWSRPDIPLHAQAMLRRMENPLDTIEGLKKEVTLSPTLAILLALVLPGSRQPTRCFGIWVMTFHSCLTSVRAEYVLEVRLPRSSSTLWRMQVPCQSNAMSQQWKPAM